MPNPTTQSQRKNAKKKGNKKTKTMTKTKTKTKTKVVQSAWCEVCRVDCNNKEVLDQHNLGKKHKKNLVTAPPTATVTSQGIVTPPVAATAPPHAMTAVPFASVADFPAVAVPAGETAPTSLPVPASTPT